jgi:hypothetical protein
MKLVSPAEAKTILATEWEERLKDSNESANEVIGAIAQMAKGIQSELEGFPNPTAVWEAWKECFQTSNRNEFFRKTEALREPDTFPLQGTLGEAISLKTGELDPLLESLCLLEAKHEILQQFEPLLGPEFPTTFDNPDAQRFIQKWEGTVEKALAEQLVGIQEDLDQKPLPKAPLPETIPNIRFGIEIEGFLLTQEPWETQKKYLEALLPYTWQVTRDWSIKTPLQTASNDNVGIEIISPILQGKHGLDEAAKVMECLQEAGLQRNRTCGLHIHSEVRRDLTTLKHIALAYQAEEARFAQLVPPHRQKNPTCGSYRQSLEIKAQASKTTPKELILNCQTLPELYESTQRDKHCGLNLAPVCTEGKPPTIEFRSFESRIQPEALIPLTAALEFTDRCLSQTLTKPQITVLPPVAIPRRKVPSKQSIPPTIDATIS